MKLSFLKADLWETSVVSFLVSRVYISKEEGSAVLAVEKSERNSLQQRAGTPPFLSESL